jgi:hypothetical protein
MMTELFLEEPNLELEELIQELATAGDYLLD